MSLAYKHAPGEGPDRDAAHRCIRWSLQEEASGKTPKELLNARAVHRRNSPNWRDASPIFDRVLAEDPDDLLALAGRVELYNMAGLPRTALGVLEQAVRRAPESVNLLNMYGSQLRLLGLAPCHCARTAGVEGTARRRVGGRRQVTAQHDAGPVGGLAPAGPDLRGHLDRGQGGGSGWAEAGVGFDRVV